MLATLNDIHDCYEKKADEARTDFMGALSQAITDFEQEAKKHYDLLFSDGL